MKLNNKKRSFSKYSEGKLGMNNGEWTCPLCGATLDAGEKCDCQDEKSPATKGETKQSSISITQAGGFGKYD